jgi:hypothetical protein
MKSDVLGEPEVTEHPNEGVEEIPHLYRQYQYIWKTALNKPPRTLEIFQPLAEVCLVSWNARYKHINSSQP